MGRFRSPYTLVFITVFIDLIGFGIVIPVLPLYAQRYNTSPEIIGLLLALITGLTLTVKVGARAEVNNSAKKEATEEIFPEFVE